MIVWQEDSRELHDTSILCQAPTFQWLLQWLLHYFQQAKAPSCARSEAPTRFPFSFYLLYWYRSTNNDVKAYLPRLYYFLLAKAASWAGSEASINSLFCLLNTAPPPKTMAAFTSSTLVKWVICSMARGQRQIRRLLGVAQDMFGSKIEVWPKIGTDALDRCSRRCVWQ